MVFQFESNLNVFKGVVILYQEIVAALTVRGTDETSPYSALVKSFLRLAGSLLLCIRLNERSLYVVKAKFSIG